MEFVEIESKEYECFWKEYPNKNFLSSPKIAKLKEQNGWKTKYVGVQEKNKLIAAAMLICKKRFLKYYEFYSPRGLLIDYNNKELLSFFVKKIKKYIKERKGYVLRIDPYIIRQERDIDGNVVENGEDNTQIITNLKKNGFIRIDEKEFEQASWMFSLDIENKTKEEVFKAMKPNTRNYIKKCEKIGINIRELKYEELGEFLNILKETSTRKNFAIRDLGYFQNMYKLFSKSNEVKFFITELDLNAYKKTLKEQRQKKEKQVLKFKEAEYNKKQKQNILKEIDCINRRIKEAEEIRKTQKRDIITLSSSMFMLVKPEVIYLFSGNYDEYMKFNSQYLIQWELIKYGIDNGFKKHNFYGIPAHINKHPKDYGIYEFKRGFNGYVEELIGEFHLPITYHYHLLRFIKKIKKF